MAIDLLRPFAGLGLFLFAMQLIESALEQAAGRSFRLIIRRNTATPLQGVASGTFATALLQSSSLVGLLMLALVGAGVIEMRNALSVIFGANLGTTVTGWIVATIGFKLDLDALALPLLGVGGLLVVASRRHGTRQLFRLVFGIGLLLMGLTFLKTALSDSSGNFDSSMLSSFGPVGFLVFGIVFTVIVQSSSAAMAVTLSALYGGLVDLPSAAAIAVGADLGTTSTVLLGAFKGSAAKKRLATGHLLFNAVTDAFAFMLIGPLLALIAWVGIGDPLISLVAFHSLFNLLGVVVFLPLVGPFGSFLERHFSDSESRANRHLDGATTAVPETAVEAIELETTHLLQRVIRQNLLVFDPPIRIAKGRLPVGPARDPEIDALSRASFIDEYVRTKQLEGEILEFTLEAQSTAIDTTQSNRIERCQRAVREAVHASKSLKDIQTDLAQFEGAGNPTLAAYGQRLRDAVTEYYLMLFGFRDNDADRLSIEDIIALNRLSHRGHEEIHRTIYDDIRRDRLGQADISSLLNANRELYASCRSLSGALAAFTLEPEQIRTLETLPDTGL